MDYSILINAVECHKCLYDKSNKEYKNIIIKEHKWGEIAELTGISKDECKKRWNLLREKFNKELKKTDMPTGSEAAGGEWPYLESMMFLKPFIQPRKTKSNNLIVEESETDDTVSEVTPSKRRKIDPFAESCNNFNNFLKRFEDRQQAKEDDLDEQFLKTIKLMIKDLPESLKNTARGEITAYITNLRADHLSGLNGN